tara:strand:+ start:149 stop:403 length:255 start_codon:yes stop_codon:yes gene_type:complete
MVAEALLLETVHLVQDREVLVAEQVQLSQVIHQENLEVQHELVVRQRNHLLVVVLDMDTLEAEDFVLVVVTKVVAAAVQVLLAQ